MNHNHSSNPRFFFSKKLLLFFVLMIAIVASAFQLCYYLNRYQEQLDIVLTPDTQSWQESEWGQRLLDQSRLLLFQLAHPNWEGLVMTYNYPKGRLGSLQIEEVTYYSWNKDQKALLELTWDPNQKINFPNFTEPLSLNQLVGQWGWAATGELIEESLKGSLDFVFIIDQNSLANFDPIDQLTVPDQADASRPQSQMLASYLFSYQDFFKRVDQLDDQELILETNMSFAQLLQVGAHYHLDRWNEHDQLEINSMDQLHQAQERLALSQRK